MEFYTPGSFESDATPEKTGESKDGKKKKKKTSRIPKATGILPKIEAEESSTAENEKKAEPESALVAMITKEAREKEKSSELLIPDATEEGAEVLPAETFEALEEEPVDLPDTLEGEFSEEGTIIGRVEAPNTEVKQEVASASKDVEEAATEPVESPGGTIEPLIPPSPPKGFEAPLPDEPAPIAETGLQENLEAASTPRRSIIDYSSRYDPAVTAERARVERAEPTITRSEHESEVHYARQRATSRGVLAGGVFGYWLGRRGRRAAEQEAGNAHEVARKQSKKIERLETEQAIASERFRNIQNTQAELINHTRASEQVQSGTTNVESKLANKEVITPNSEKLSPKAGLAPEDQPVTEETYHAPAGRRVETSSWHRYEVDEKTGKVVENPELAYGQEFQKEQRQERLQRPTTEPKVAMQLGQAVVQNASTSSTPVQPYAGASTEVKPTAKEKNLILFKKTYLKQQFIRRTTDPFTWIVALGLVVLLFMIGVLS